MRNFVCLGNAKLTQLARNWKQSLIQKYSKRSAAKKFDVTQSRIQEWVKQEMELRNQKKGAKRVIGLRSHQCARW
uniref:Brinker DNA-binding domain-containing protein n=1 Tax=Ditylenchus dipsaci TaxID=166011 RepID=A0A915D8C1_9BILA